MRKRTIQVLNWDKYQARTDKEMPWCKLWGALFKRPWFQLLKDDEKFVTIVFLDLARQFNNKIPDLSEFKGYLKGNYGVFMTEERVFNLCKSLSHNGFLSDNMSDIQDKIREEKNTESDKPTKKQKQTDEEFISELKNDPINAGVDFDVEFQKMDRWLAKPENSHRKKTQRFIRGWIDRADRVVTGTFTKKADVWSKAEAI